MTAEKVHRLDRVNADKGVCGADLLPWPETPQEDWDWTEDYEDITCLACRTEEDERRFDQSLTEYEIDPDYENQGPMRAYDAAVDRDIESRRER